MPSRKLAVLRLKTAFSDVGPFSAWRRFSCAWLFLWASCVNVCRYGGSVVRWRVVPSPFVRLGSVAAPSRSLFAVLVHVFCS